MRHSPIVIHRKHYETANDSRNGKNSNAVEGAWRGGKEKREVSTLNKKS